MVEATSKTETVTTVVLTLTSAEARILEDELGSSSNGATYNIFEALFDLRNLGGASDV